MVILTIYCNKLFDCYRQVVSVRKVEILSISKSFNKFHDDKVGFEIDHSNRIFCDGLLDILEEIGNEVCGPRRFAIILGKRKNARTKLKFYFKKPSFVASWFLLKSVGGEFMHHHWQFLDENGSSNKRIKEHYLESHYVYWVGVRVAFLQSISGTPYLDQSLLKQMKDFNMHSMTGWCSWEIIGNIIQKEG